MSLQKNLLTLALSAALDLGGLTTLVPSAQAEPTPAVVDELGARVLAEI